MRRKMKRWYRRNRNDLWDFLVACTIVFMVPAYYVFVCVLRAILGGG